MKRESDPQPTVPLNICADPSDFKQIGCEQTFNTSHTTTYSAMADTGCQSCLAGTDLLKSLGLEMHHLVPVSMRMTAANNEGIEIVGALPLRIGGLSQSGSKVSTRQIVYFTPSTKRMFLSQSACKDLGLISLNFPIIGETLEVNDNNSQSSMVDKPCSCPKRQMPPPLPHSLPYPPTEENLDKLEKYLLDRYKSSTFNTCEHQLLPKMTGPPMRIMTDPNCTPHVRHKPIPIPIHWQEEVYNSLTQDVELGVIEPVPTGTPITWCHRMVVVPKKSGKPRRTVDFQPLNRYAIRETHHTESPFHLARAVPPKTYKTVMDAWNGYHSIPLHPDDKHLTTFITPRGRFRYCVAPQGYIASGDAYTRRYDELVMDFPCKVKCIDDCLLWSNSIEEEFYHTAAYLDLCGKNGIVLNPSKFVFARKTVEFSGFIISSNTVKPAPKLFNAIKDFPTPQNITDIRSWFGLINQVSYAFTAVDRMLPFRQLLKPGTPFKWDNNLDQLFNETKALIIDEIQDGIEIFDKKRPTCLATDWSKEGIGFLLLQKHCSCNTIKPLCCKTGWKVSLVGSRFTTGTESRYSPIEGEALAVVDALQKARHFILGCDNLIIAVDHKPLIKIFNDKSLEDIHNPRLLKLKEKTLKYKFQILHIPGVKNTAADAMSRHPTNTSNIFDDLDPLDISTSPIKTYDETSPKESHHLCEPINNVETVSWDDIRIATSSDPLMCLLLNYVEDGMPDKRDNLHPELRQYHQYRKDLTTYDGVLLYKDRIIVPPLLRDRVLSSLHAAHQGVTQMTSRADTSVFWPGITTDINILRNNCNSCNRNAPSQPNAPPTPPTMPAYPFQCIVSDFFQYGGHNYLVLVDRYSNWPVVEKAGDGAQGLVSALRTIFVTFGISEELTSDGGGEYMAEVTKKFLSSWGVRHRLSSVAFPHSNQRAEGAVKVIKRMIMDNTGPNGTLHNDRFQRALLHYRNTPDRETGLSPAMCIFGRTIRDFIPVHPGRYLPHPAWRETLIAREESLRNRHYKMSEKLSEHTQHLPPLKIGDCVRVQNQRGPHPTKWDRTGVVIEVRQFDQYIVRIDGSGRVTLRNRKHLRKYIPVVAKTHLLYHPGQISSKHQITPTNYADLPRLNLQSVPTNPTTKLECDKPSNKQPIIPEGENPHNIDPTMPQLSPQRPTASPRFQQNTSSPKSIPIPPLMPDLSFQDDDTTSSPTNETQSTTPKRTNVCKKPLILRQLETYNAPGLGERGNSTGGRTSRNSNKSVSFVHQENLGGRRGVYNTNPA